jgi:LPS-assembly protein
MKKDGINYSNIFSPKYMFRYAPGHMRNLNDSFGVLDYTNLYSLNKTDEIENGLSAILGFEFKTNKKIQNNQEIQKFSLSLGQVFNLEENDDLPSQSSLNQKTSDLVGQIGYNFSEMGSINYKFSIDENLNDLVNNEVSTVLDFGALSFNLDYLEQNKHRGSEHFVSSGITLNYNDNNQFNFSTKKNFKTDSTEYYDWKYQYQLDCLTAGLLYRREFYHDTDLDPNDTLMFSVTFVPFGTINSPVQNP